RLLDFPLTRVRLTHLLATSWSIAGLIASGLHPHASASVLRLSVMQWSSALRRIKSVMRATPVGFIQSGLFVELTHFRTVSNISAWFFVCVSSVTLAPNLRGNLLVLHGHVSPVNPPYFAGG